MRTSIFFTMRKPLVANLAWMQFGPQHILVHCLKEIKFNFSGAKQKVWDEVLVLFMYLYLVSGKKRIDMPI